jgi:mannose-1-phosphate guanylyltransferase
MVQRRPDPPKSLPRPPARLVRTRDRESGDVRHGVIMAGGAGTRLWPLSRAARPKHLLEVVGGRSLLALAYERLTGVLDSGSIFVCTVEANREAVLASLPALPPENVIGEPFGRDTASAIGLCATLLQATDPAATFVVATADHVIEPVAAFQEALRAGFTLAEAAPRLVTFGIVPTSPHTGLGYIERGGLVPGAGGLPTPGYDVVSFTEKPDAATAAAYVGSGRYLWNSGMFVWQATAVLDQLRRHQPDLAERLDTIGAAPSGADRTRVVAEVYEDLQKISIDYAVLEPAARERSDAVAVVPLGVEWLDVGSWATLAKTLPADQRGNALGGLSVLVDSSDNIIITDDPDHLVAAIGARGMIVVATSDVTMVCPRSDAERVKQLVAAVQDAHGDRFS